MAAVGADRDVSLLSGLLRAGNRGGCIRTPGTHNRPRTACPPFVAVPTGTGKTEGVVLAWA